MFMWHLIGYVGAKELKAEGVILLSSCRIEGHHSGVRKVKMNGNQGRQFLPPTSLLPINATPAVHNLVCKP